MLKRMAISALFGSMGIGAFIASSLDLRATTGVGPVAPQGSSPPEPSSAAPRDFTGNKIKIIYQCVECHKAQQPIEMERYYWGTHYNVRIDCLQCHGSTGHNDYVALGYQFRLSTLGADGRTLIGSGEEKRYVEWWPKMLVRAYQACQNCHPTQYWEWVGLDRQPEKLENAATPFHGYLRYDHGISDWRDTQMSSFGLAERDNWGDEMFGLGCVLCHNQTQEWNMAGPDPEHLKPIQEFFPELLEKQRESLKTQKAAYPTSGKQALFFARCVECHARHMFSKEDALRPEACAKCHMGPDHPQYEAYSTSKHGWAYKLYGGYPSGRAPTCTTCHMSEKASDGHTIHTSNRGIAWNYKKGTPEFEEARRIMLSRCQLCHSPTRIGRILDQVDIVAIEVADELRRQGVEVLKELYEQRLVTPTANPFFGEEVEFLPTFFHAMPWRSGNPRASKAELLFWNVWREFGTLSMETGAFHLNPAYTHWQGLKPADEYLGELMDYATELREERRSEAAVRVPGEFQVTPQGEEGRVHGSVTAK